MRKERDLITITRPFAIFVEETLDVPGHWTAHVVGPELDNITWHDSPEGAVFMAYDMLNLLTGRCSLEHAEHDLAVDTTIDIHFDSKTLTRPAWGCSRCDYRTEKAHVAETAGETE